jgi:hypothetical protein
MVTDCLIIGYNDGCLEDEIRSLRAMGVDHPNYRDYETSRMILLSGPYDSRALSQGKRIIK